MICVCIYMKGTPEGSTESDCVEKPEIEPATPGLKDIGFGLTGLDLCETIKRGGNVLLSQMYNALYT